MTDMWFGVDSANGGDYTVVPDTGHKIQMMCEAGGRFRMRRRLFGGWVSDYEPYVGPKISVECDDFSSAVDDLYAHWRAGTLGNTDQ